MAIQGYNNRYGVSDRQGFGSWGTYRPSLQQVDLVLATRPEVLSQLAMGSEAISQELAATSRSDKIRPLPT